MAEMNVNETASAGTAESRIAQLPPDTMIVLPARNIVLFPGVVLPLAIGRKRSIAAAQEAARSGRPLGILLQKQEGTEEPSGDDLYQTGTVANVLRYLTAPDGTHHLVVQGEQRFHVKEWLEGWPFMVARVERVSEAETQDAEIQARFYLLRDRALEAVSLLPNAPQEMGAAIQAMTSAPLLADMVATYLDIGPSEKQDLLEVLDLRQRLDRVLSVLNSRIEVMRLTKEISQQTKENVDKRQREYLLREQLRTIQKELGEADEKATEVEELSQAIDKAKMPEEVEAQARKELKRLERMPEAATEYGMVRTYLEWLTELPWAVETAKEIDLKEARAILDDEHFGLEKIKKRILEFLAVRKLNPEGKSPILCFVGPPGVGKTSLGQSIARATGRKFQRVALGGVHDESEIRGHRRTYVGALPGTIIQALKKAGSRDCVLMLDEVDKLGQGFHGDPSAALLELLDPEQNNSFRDTYLGVPFDMSRVMFIATANMLENIPGPLRDRMEVISLAGYTEEEKLQIARRYLVDRQLKSNGLKPEQVAITDEALRAIIMGYTREAGVRSLERQVGAVLRNAAVRIASGEAEQITIGPDDLQAILGGKRFENEVALRTALPGVATGLAWTPVGGDILFIEASRYPGNGKLVLTGQLGDVMKESVQAALSLLKSRAPALGIKAEDLDKQDIHVHVPAGATPKDGPSAGVAMFTALTSLLTGRSVRADVAMTGEISLRGLVLPVGGIKEKVTAAALAGVKTVMLPARNRRDYDDIPEDARNRLKFVWLETVDQAIACALGDDLGASCHQAAQAAE
ncbi:endopeptidase La [Aerophototrophica crusticola]|uniref:Lon protease n=1 Tax=Aerophototrophica crusticola TaxID=1709002 RepID=A0A858R420_9PROT|nr:endopeptidase La [Rhodospirillaceae bacterium B3]